MANYPAYPILLSSSMELESGIEDDYAQPGQQHSRVFHSQTYYDFSLTHKLTLDQWNTLDTLYQAGPRDEYTLTYYDESPAVTYTVKFTAPPASVKNLGRGDFYVTCQLRGTKD